MELYTDLDFVSLYVESIGLAIEIPTWFLVGTIGLVYSIRVMRKYK